MAPPYKILLAEDHVMFRELIKQSVQGFQNLQVIGEVGDGQELLDFLKTSTPDMVILDLDMPNIGGIEAAKEIKKRYPPVKVLILTAYKSKEFLSRSFAAGVDGYLLKENAYSDLLSAITAVSRGQSYLSALLSGELKSLLSQSGAEPTAEPLSLREIEVLKPFCNGKSLKEIAASLTISPLTVRNHLVRIKKKLGLKKKVDLVKYAVQKGYTSADYR
jgi:DNA-binding NarL/FixJ family response regulator